MSKQIVVNRLLDLKKIQSTKAEQEAEGEKVREENIKALERAERKEARQQERDAIEAKGMAMGFGKSESQIGREGDPSELPPIGKTREQIKAEQRAQLQEKLASFRKRGGKVQVKPNRGGPRWLKEKEQLAEKVPLDQMRIHGSHLITTFADNPKKR